MTDYLPEVSEALKLSSAERQLVNEAAHRALGRGTKTEPAAEKIIATLYLANQQKTAARTQNWLTVALVFFTAVQAATLVLTNWPN